MKFLALVSATALALLAETTFATEIHWSSLDVFEHTATLAPGKSTELCGRIESRSAVDWKFVGDGPLTFNIHRHSGEAVIYATRSYMTREQSGKFSPTFNFDWCWMWTNETVDPITLRVDLKR